MKTPISKSKNKVGKTVGSPRRKRHNEAIAKSEVRAAVTSLKVDWDRLSLIERGMRLQELLQAGCSTRGLEVLDGEVIVEDAAAYLTGEWRLRVEFIVSLALRRWAFLCRPALRDCGNERFERHSQTREKPHPARRRQGRAPVGEPTEWPCKRIEHSAQYRIHNKL